jgi:hypothetical protein
MPAAAMRRAMAVVNCMLRMIRGGLLEAKVELKMLMMLWWR